MFENVTQKVQIGDKVKIVSVDELKELYSNDENKHTLDTLTFLSQQDLIGEVKNVEQVDEDLFEYTVQFGIVTVKLYDSDFDKVTLPTGDLYIDTPVYLCVDMRGGMCDRLCFGYQALIDNANASIDCWNTNQCEEVHKYIDTVQDAIAILNTDEFKVVAVLPHSVFVTEEYIVTDVDTMILDNYKTLIHNPIDIWNKIKTGEYTKLIIDLTVSTSNGRI